MLYISENLIHVSSYNDIVPGVFISSQENVSNAILLRVNDDDEIKSTAENCKRSCMRTSVHSFKKYSMSSWSRNQGRILCFPLCRDDDT